MPVLVDTSALVALSDRDSAEHHLVRGFVTGTEEVLVVPVTVLPEADYLIGSRFGAGAALAVIRAMLAGEFRLELLTLDDIARAAEIMQQYAGSDVGLVDASIVAAAERLRVTRIVTLDRRHFGMFRPRHCSAFELVP